jgi:hypothetical protein
VCSPTHRVAEDTGARIKANLDVQCAAGIEQRAKRGQDKEWPTAQDAQGSTSTHTQTHTVQNSTRTDAHLRLPEMPTSAYRPTAKTSTFTLAPGMGISSVCGVATRTEGDIRARAQRLATVRVQGRTRAGWRTLQQRVPSRAPCKHSGPCSSQRPRYACALGTTLRCVHNRARVGTLGTRCDEGDT